MKKTIIFFCCLGLLTVFGCSSDDATPENFGKNYIKKKFSGIQCDLDDLDISVSDEEDNTATVKIEGEIKYEETLALVKKGEKWMLAKDAAKLEAKEKKAEKAEPKKKAGQ